MRNTKGQRRLAAWLDSTGTSKADLGKKIGVTGQGVSAWVHGICPPAEKHWALIEAITEIPGVEFLTADERRERDKRIARDAKRLAELQAERTGTTG